VTSVAAQRAMNRIRGPLPCRRSGDPLVLVNDASENGVSTDHGVDVRFGPDFGATFVRRALRKPLTWASCG
jgi:hypothetical protein